MEKNSKINSIEPKGDFETSYGKMYSFHIKFENEDEGQINAKTEEPKFKVGEEMTYTLTTSDWGNKIKRVSTFNSGGNFNQPNPDRDARICRQNALTNAVNYFNNSASITNEIATPKEIISLAEELSDWTCNGEKKEPF